MTRSQWAFIRGAWGALVGEPETIRWLVSDLAGDLAAEDGVLVPEYEQLRP
jgi:hypothetical protein